MARDELDSAIVQSIAEIDAIMKRTLQVSDVIFRELDKVIISKFERTDWHVIANWGDDESIWFAPNEWRTPGSDKRNEFSAYFELDRAFGDSDDGLPTEDYFYLTRICKAGLGEVGFHFRQSVCGRPRARKILPAFSDQFRRYGFVMNDEPTFFLPTAVSSDALSEGILQGKLDKAFQPIMAAIDNIIEARPKFDALVQAFAKAG